MSEKTRSVKQMTLSIIVPCYNEEGSLAPFITALDRVLAKNIHWAPGRMEIIFVDDGSSDNTLSCMLKMAARDKRLYIIALS